MDCGLWVGIDVRVFVARLLCGDDVMEGKATDLGDDVGLICVS